jgi:hypothetical protein
MAFSPTGGPGRYTAVGHPEKKKHIPLPRSSEGTSKGYFGCNLSAAELMQ